MRLVGKLGKKKDMYPFRQLQAAWFSNILLSLGNIFFFKLELKKIRKAEAKITFLFKGW